MKILYTSSDDLQISGSAEELLNLRKHILVLAKSESTEFTLAAETNYNPANYNQILKRLVITLGNGAIKIYVINNELRIESSPENLLILASCFNDFEKYQYVGYHKHFEYFDWLEHIDAASVPLVIAVK